MGYVYCEYICILNFCIMGTLKLYDTLWYFSMLSNTNIGHIGDIHWNFQTTWCGSFNHKHIDCSVNPRHLFVQIMSWEVFVSLLFIVAVTTSISHSYHTTLSSWVMGFCGSIPYKNTKNTMDFWMFWGVLRSETGDWDDHIRWILIEMVTQSSKQTIKQYLKHVSYHPNKIKDM